MKNKLTSFLLILFCSSSADGDPVIFLHGYTDSWHSFEKVLMHLPLSVHAYELSQPYCSLCCNKNILKVTQPFF